MTKMRRVVVTGMGAVTPLGCDLKSTWDGLIRGRSGIAKITNFDASEFPTQIAGEIKGFPFSAWEKKQPQLKHASRGTFFGIQAADEAYRDAGLIDQDLDRKRFGIYFASGDSGVDFDPFVETLKRSFTGERNEVDQGKYLKLSSKFMHPMRELEIQPFMAVTHLAKIFDLRGPVSNCITACAASAQAMGEAFHWIRNGEADLVMTGGCNSMVYPLGVAGFSLLTALSERNDEPEKASRPFDKDRDGFVLSEGAGVLILEDLDHALARGVKIYGELTGYGVTTDAFRLTDMEPGAVAASRAVTLAMKQARVQSSEVDYISAHGTSTKVNDLSETQVVKNTMASDASRIPISSIKSMVGHMITAAGAVEAETCFLAMRDGVIPPTINYETQDPDCDLDYVPNQARKIKVSTCISNSFGFGGQNISLVMRSYQP